MPGETKPMVSGSMMGGDADDSSSDEEVLEVCAEIKDEPAPKEIKDVSDTQPPPKAAPTKKLDDSDEEEDEPTKPTTVNALAGISLRPKSAGRGNIAGQIRPASKQGSKPLSTAPTYGDEVWGRDTNEAEGEQISLSNFAPRSKKKAQQKE